MNRNQ